MAIEILNYAPVFGSSNLKAYYRFESGALTTDSSGNSNTLTAISDPAETTGKFGGGVVFDTNDAYSIASDADFHPAEFTIGCWVKKTAPGAGNTTMGASWIDSGSKYYGWLFGLAVTTGLPYMLVAKGTGKVAGTDYARVDGETNCADGTWHFVCATYYGATLRLYVDGVYEDGVSWAGGAVYTASQYDRIGCRNDTGTNIEFLDGSLDDFFILHEGITSQQVAQIYQTRIKQFLNLGTYYWEINALTNFYTDYSVACAYRFRISSPLVDSSGQGNTLTAISDPSYATDNLLRYGAYAGLDANDAYSMATATELRPTGNFTIGCWFKRNGIPTSTGVIYQSVILSSSKYYGIYLGVSVTTGYVRIFTAKGTGAVDGTDYKYAHGTSNVCDNTWHWLVGSWDGSNINIYVDGVLQSQTAWAYAPASAASHYHRIGCYNTAGSDSNFVGVAYLDEVFATDGYSFTQADIDEISPKTKSVNGLAFASVKAKNGIY